MPVHSILLAGGTARSNAPAVGICLPQLLTEEVGHPALAQHLHAVTALMTAARNWDDFKRMINVALPKKGANLEFNFVEPTNEAAN
jgi:hypothetical protein